LASDNPRIAAAYALTGELIQDSDEARDAELYVTKNNRYVTNTAAVSKEPIHDLACNGKIVLVSDGTNSVIVLSYPSLKLIGHLDMETDNIQYDIGSCILSRI